LCMKDKINTTKVYGKEIVSYFDSVAKDRNYVFSNDKIIEYEQKMRSKAVLEMLKAESEDFVLDLGCANGRDLIELSGRGVNNFLGVDISPEMIAEAKREFVLRSIDTNKVEVGDAVKLDFGDNVFDKLIASEVIEHIPNVSDAIKEMNRVLKPGGKLVISTPNKKSWYGFDRLIYKFLLGLSGKKDRHPYDEWKTFSEVKGLLDENGFKIIEIKGACYLPGFLFLYRMPDFIKKLIVFLVSKIEPWLSRVFLKNGYIVCIKAEKING